MEKEAEKKNKRQEMSDMKGSSVIKKKKPKQVEDTPGNTNEKLIIFCRKNTHIILKNRFLQPTVSKVQNYVHKVLF